MLARTEPHPTDIYVGAKIRARRWHLGLSQTELGDALELTFQQVQKYERGANRVSASKLLDIALALKTIVGWFFEGLEANPAAEESPLAPAFIGCADAADLMAIWPLLPVQLRRQLLRLFRTFCDFTDQQDSGSEAIFSRGKQTKNDTLKSTLKTSKKSRRRAANVLIFREKTSA